MNQSIGLKEVPSSWKVAMVTPIFKSGSRAAVAKYRPITILPTISKVAEKWVLKLLIFCTHHSTETVNCVFDLKKSNTYWTDSYVGTDTVNHQVLLAKLSNFNFSTDTMKWFKSFLENRKQCVMINRHASRFQQMYRKALDHYCFPYTVYK